VARLLWLVVVAALSACAGPYHQGPKSDHFDGERFFDPIEDRPDKGLWDVLKWRMTTTAGPWPDWVENKRSDIPPARVEGQALRVAMVNHNTLLLQTQGLNILTDPHWSARASPVQWAGPKRVRAPGIRFEDLPKIDIILLSHNHFDHMDKATLERLWLRDRPRILTPLGNDAILRDEIGGDIAATVMDWWQALEVAPGVQITLVPMQHWSRRTFSDTNKALWGGFVIEAPGGPIYFVGDTGFGGGRYFKAIGDRFGPLRLTLMPIGAYQPRWFMEYSHQTPAESVAAHTMAKSCRSIPTQVQTFPMADDGYDAPLTDLAAALKAAGISAAAFPVLENGDATEVPALVADASGPRCAPL
jgi:L-ascorbate metabolism protein UlaG (beta-lactamase superfamily)